jgi:holliday junction DNA helicase RuvA
VIAFVRGRVATVGPEQAVVDLSGVGIAVQCTPATLAGLRPGAETQLATSLVVREDSLTLYGFADDDERSVFELLQTASGVGPRLAQAMLAVHGPDDLRRAVTTEDLTALTKVPGIGRKGAQRIVLELRDRLGPPTGPTGSDRTGRSPDADGWRGQVHAALLGLGWTTREADAAVDAVAPVAESSGPGSDVPGLLKAALRTLNRS